MKELLSFQLSAAARSEATRAPWFREGAAGAKGGAKPAVRGLDAGVAGLAEWMPSIGASKELVFGLRAAEATPPCANFFLTVQGAAGTGVFLRC